MTNVTSIDKSKHTPADVLAALERVKPYIRQLAVVYTVRDADGTDRVKVDWSAQSNAEACYSAEVLKTEIMELARR